MMKTAKKDDGYEWTWTQPKDNKDIWNLTHIPDGECMTPQIKRLSKNSDGSYTFIVYRDGKYIDCENDLERAKVIAKKGVMRPERILSIAVLRKYIKETPRDPIAFSKLSKLGQQTITDVMPHLLPRKSDFEKNGVKPPRSNRGDLLTKQEKKASDLPMDSVIKRVNPKNPKRENTDAWVRWELLFQHDGKTVGDFIRAHGNPTTLKNAVRSGHVSAEGVK